MIDNYIVPVSIDEIDGNGVLLQSGFWGEFKKHFGWFPYAFAVNGLPLLALVRPLVGNFAVCYVPHGPNEPMEHEFLARLAAGLTRHIKERCVHVRFDLPWIKRTGASNSKSIRKAPVDVQPSSTVIVDLQKDEEEILSSMKSKTRYNIRLSAKRGVNVSEGRVASDDDTDDDLSQWYSLHRETAERDKIAIHSLAYYRTLFQLSRSYSGCKPSIHLLKATADNMLLAGMILVIHGKYATYLAGASSSQKRNLMPAYALQWFAMQKAKEHGCVAYDMFGIPPDDDPAHPMHGLYRFKTGFGGHILHRAGCWDYPVRKALYAGYYCAEIGRAYYYKQICKR